MTDEKHQAELLDEFRTRLRSNPNARPPAGLDPATVAFMRKLRRDASPATAPDPARSWAQVLDTARTTGSDLPTGKDNPMLRTQTLAPQQKATPYTLIAAALLVLLFVAFVTLNGGLSLPQTPHTGSAGPASPVDPPPAAVAPQLDDDDIPAGYVPVVTTLLPLQPGTQIVERMLAYVYWPEDAAPPGALTDMGDLIGTVTQRSFAQFAPIIDERFLPTVVPTVITATPVPSITPTLPSSEDDDAGKIAAGASARTQTQDGVPVPEVIPDGYAPVLATLVFLTAGHPVQPAQAVVVLWPEDALPEGTFSDPADLNGLYVAEYVPQFMPLLDVVLTDDPDSIELPTAAPTVTPVPSLTFTPTPDADNSPTPPPTPR